MTKRAARFTIPFLWVQLVGCVAAATVLAGWPPQTGRMMLVALDGDAASRIAALAINAHARLVAPGPWRRSYVVEGDRAAMLRAALPAGMIVVAAPVAGCGAADDAA